MKPNKMYLAVIGVTALAMLGSTLAVVSSWQIGSLFVTMADKHVPSLRAAHGVEISLLEQRGFVSSYLLEGGNPEWLEELTRRTGEFEQRLVPAEEEAQTTKEKEILNQLTEIHRQYGAKREEVIALFDAGQAEKAEQVFSVM